MTSPRIRTSCSGGTPSDRPGGSSAAAPATASSTGPRWRSTSPTALKDAAGRSRSTRSASGPASPASAAPTPKLGAARFEREQQLPQQRVQLDLLVLRERGREERLLAPLHLDRRFPCGSALRRELDEHPASVTGIGKPLQEPERLEPVEAARDRSGRELEVARQRARRAQLPCLSKRQRGQDTPVLGRQVVVDERLLERVADALVDAADPVDDPLHLEIEACARVVEPREQVVDVVFRHGHILTSNLLTSRVTPASLSISRYSTQREETPCVSQIPCSPSSWPTLTSS